MYRTLLLAASATLAAGGCTEGASDSTSASAGAGGDVRIVEPLTNPSDTTAGATAQAEAQRRAQAARMREQLRDLQIDATVAVGIATGFKIITLQAQEAAEALRSGRVEGGDAVVIERSAPVRPTLLTF